MDPREDLKIPPDALHAVARALTEEPGDAGLQRALCHAIYVGLRGELYRRAERLLARWRSSEVEDLLHDTMCVVFRKGIRLCQTGKLAHAKGPEAVTAYFRKIAQNSMTDALAKFVKTRPFSLEAEPQARERGDVELSLELLEMLDLLDPTDRLIVEMRYERYTYKQIVRDLQGRNLHISVEDARVRFLRATRRLRKLVTMPDVGD